MKLTDQKIRAIKWENDFLYLLDQRLLPNQEVYVQFTSSRNVADAIRDMVVRGAPAIGITAAYAVVLSAQSHRDLPNWREAVLDDIEILQNSRPTAVNLAWALTRMRKRLLAEMTDPVNDLLQEAQTIHQEDVTANYHMAKAGAAFLVPGSRVLTHCNTGALATGGYGTALGVIRRAWEKGKLERVYADETRPWLQGSRLTAWELQQEGIPTTLICEGAAASLMRQQRVDWVIVGADRIVANGDVANKIGTYSLAVLARQHGVKFMVVAPNSTVDMTIGKGSDIPIEFRSAEELIKIGEIQVGVTNIDAWNPAFDITPSELIDCIVTETAVIECPNRERMRATFR
ncbi:MAG: S-methyl-5-thioribose-1-phosphate isomerase [Gammaproteobacteria bacterium]|nr:S-methyl-5-thioribose-1-phosphate isomerase [Gammaproteobacteria bacterium]